MTGAVGSENTYGSKEIILSAVSGKAIFPKTIPGSQKGREPLF